MNGLVELYLNQARN